MGLQGGASLKGLLAFIACVVASVAIGIIAIMSTSNDIPDAKTQLRSMGFVMVAADGNQGHISLPDIKGTGNCRLSVYREYKTWRLSKPSFTDNGSVVTDAAQTRKLPEVEQWCGLPKQ